MAGGGAVNAFETHRGKNGRITHGRGNISFGVSSTGPWRVAVIITHVVAEVATAVSRKRKRSSYKPLCRLLFARDTIDHCLSRLPTKEGALWALEKPWAPWAEGVRGGRRCEGGAQMREPELKGR